MSILKKNVVVVGGSYVGKATAQKLAEAIPSTHRVLLIEPHSHFHHIFTFPRFAVVPGHENKAFIPYSTTFSSSTDSARHAIIQARVISLESQSLTLDREWEGSNEISFEYAVIATGSTLSQPCAVGEDEKKPSVKYLRNHQIQVGNAKSILIAGGGAAGVQMATDIKERFPQKEVILIQSRDRLMPKFDRRLHEIIKRRFDELGVKMITGARVVIPQGGFPEIQTPIEVQLTNRTSIRTDFVILATGQRPNNALVRSLQPSNGQSIINPENGMIRVRPTLQLADSKYDNLFAVGDIADTGSHKAARPGVMQAAVVAANINSLIRDESPQERFSVAPAGIHMTLGLTYNVLFVNPNPREGQMEPKIVEKFDGREDMNVDFMWKRMGLQVTSSDDYNL